MAAVQALKLILNKFKYLKETKREDGLGEIQANWAVSQMTPITIYMSLLSDNFIEQPILDKTSVDLIVYIKHYYDKQEEIN